MGPMATEDIVRELEQVRLDFGQLLSSASRRELHRRSDGTRWTNRELLFHMLFGYLVVRSLLPLVAAFSRVPDVCSRRFAAALNLVQRPFHVINYLGPVVAVRVLNPVAMMNLTDRALTALQHSVTTRSDVALARHAHFPTTWDPYFLDVMTARQLYHYGTQHYGHHRRQLTVNGIAPEPAKAD
jgi:hypothetical protein